MANRLCAQFPFWRRTTALIALLLALSGCGTVHGWARGGSDLKPAAGAGVSVPLGK